MVFKPAKLILRKKNWNHKEGNIILEIKNTKDLSNQVYQDALLIRRRVFMDEQHVSEAEEIDQDEASTLHFVGYIDQRPIVTARLKELPNKGYLVQRVATMKSDRGHGYGRELLTHLADYAKKTGKTFLQLGAQDQAILFYEKLGYRLLPEPGYLDAGIAHHEMRLNLA